MSCHNHNLAGAKPGGYVRDILRFGHLYFGDVLHALSVELRTTIQQSNGISKDCACDDRSLGALMAVMKTHPASQDKSLFLGLAEA